MSPYSAKTRSYLRYKRVPFDDVAPGGITLLTRIRRAVGRSVMPTVRMPDGSWLQDTSDIIDAFERRAPEPSITPPGGTQRLAASLVELHGDEWLPLAALHYRWNHPENAAFARREFGRNGFPWLPGALGRRAARPFADQMASYLPRLGVSDATAPGVEAFARGLIGTLNTHLTVHDYLLGGRPCIGDFALFGPLWAHLFRDPASTSLFDGAPAVRDWLDRLERGAEPSGDWVEADEVPTTLDPLFATMFAEQMVFVRGLLDAIDVWCADHPDASRVPRSLGDHPFTVGGREGTRKLVTFTQWMVQRPADVHASLAGDELERAEGWLARVGGAGWFDRPIRHRFERREFKMHLARPPAEVLAAS